MPQQRIVVIGASAGGLVAVRALLSCLDSNFPAPVLVAMHMSSDHKSLLPGIFSRAGPVPAVQAEDGQTLTPGRVYVAAPGCHLIATPDCVRVTKGARENSFRPSIDVLFRSAAYHWGPAAIGVVLSGSLDDGSSGLYAIKRMGGIALVQHPDDAEVASMPLSALRRADIDYKALASEMGVLLNTIVQQAPGPESADAKFREQLKADVDIAASDSGIDMSIMEYGEPTRYTCPSCHGVLFRINEGPVDRFRCHTGHGFSFASLVHEQRVHLEDQLWQGLRSLQESIAILNDAAERLSAAGDETGAAEFREKAADAKSHADVLRVLTRKEGEPDPHPK